MTKFLRAPLVTLFPKRENNPSESPLLTSEVNYTKSEVIGEDLS